MKNAIGSLSALITLSAVAASAGIVASPFANEELDLDSNFSLPIDMNGDATNDFTIAYANSSGSIIGETSNEIFVLDAISTNAKPFALGEEINLSETGATSAFWTNLVEEGFSYVGVKFQREGQTNLGWIQFFLPNSSTGVLVRGAWNNTPDAAIPAGGGSAQVTPSNGPFAGGNMALITNAAPHIGSGTDITNVLVGAVCTTNIFGQGTNWVSFVAPAAESSEAKDIVIQSGSVGNTILTSAYTYNPAPVQDGWLAIQVTPAAGNWQLTAPVGYTGPTAGTGNLAAVSAVTGGYGIAYGALTGYVASSNQTQFVTGGSTSLFAGVYLLISTNIGTPEVVSATEGTYTNRIRVTWQGVAGATGYEIWRSLTNDANLAGRIADVPENQSAGIKELSKRSTFNAQHSTSAEPQNARCQSAILQSLNRSITESLTFFYDDYAINPICAYYYWVRAKTTTLISPMSYVGMGYAELGSGQTVGRSDLTVSDMVFLPVNLTNGSPAGTVSYRLANGGPDTLTAAPVRFDFYMVQSNQAVWMAYNETNVTLAVGAEQLLILDASARQWLRVRADLAGRYTVQTRVRHLDLIGDQHTGSNTTDAAGTVLVKASGVNSPGRSLNDYDGDGKSDVCVYQSALGRWYAKLSGDRYSSDPSVGDVGMGWSPAAGDYDGDGITDVAAYEPSSGQWLVRFSSSGLVGDCWLGGAEFTAAQCDFDGDVMTDPVVYREADGYWVGASSLRQYTLPLSDASLGGIGCQSVIGDYDGDGLADPAVYNRETGLWQISLSGSNGQVVSGIFGGSGYLPAPADYDGDGKTDPSVYAPAAAHWQVLLSGTLDTEGDYTWCDIYLITAGGLPVPADYDGDGLADPAVYHQDPGYWELFHSSQGYQLSNWGYFGGAECQPATE